MAESLVTKQYAYDAVSFIAAPDTTEELLVEFKSYSPDAKYIVFKDGTAQCPLKSGSMKVDMLFNDVPVLPPRVIQTSSEGTTALSMHKVLTCSDAVANADDGTYDNVVRVQFTWSLPDGVTSTTGLTPPGYSALSVTLLQTA